MQHLDVLIAAPSDPAGLPAWGDYHFARGLQAALHRAGVRSRLLFRDTHETAPPPPAGSDLLVIRGKFAPSAAWLVQASYGRRLLWQISWPLDPTVEEWQAYDRIAVASAQDLPRIARLSGRPCLLLPQATAFAPPPGWPGPQERPLLFVGSTRGLLRPIVADFVAAHLPLQLIGQGWERFGLAAEPAIANTQLPRLYSRALAVLNDHHSAMAAYGYLNNRLFDVLACGVPLITDVAPGCPAGLAAAVIRHRPGTDPPRRSLERAMALQGQPELLQAVARETRRHHSFAARVDQLLAALDPPS
ncbi:MAG: glycosyltransferase [Cyanobium sp.]|nr:glycosyltransferase [Cyanobium sp.]